MLQSLVVPPPDRHRDAGVVGFFSANTVLEIADDGGQPSGSRVIGSPPPDMTGAA